MIQLQNIHKKKDKEDLEIDENLVKEPKYNKRKIITYSIFGTVTLFVFTFMIFSFDSNENDKKITEIETPISESEKYDTKIKAMEKEENKEQKSISYMEKSLEDKKKEKDQQEELQKNIDQMNKNEKNLKTEPIETNTGKSYTHTKQNNTNQNFKKSETEEYSQEKNMRHIEKKETLKKFSKNEEINSNFFNKNEKTSNNSERLNNDTSGNEQQISQTDKMIYACVHTDQTVMNNNRIKLRLTRKAIIDDIVYPINTIVYGLVTIEPNRLKVLINSINQNPAKLEVYDAEDSSKGIYVLTPTLNETMKKELQKEGIDDDDISKIPFSKTLKNLFKKKIEEQRIDLLNNYKIIIKVKKKNEND
jgi:Conjugative transposon, TraM